MKKVVGRGTRLAVFFVVASSVLYGTTTPTTLRYSNGTVELFAVRADGNVWHNWQLTPGGTAGSGWVSLGSAGGGFSQSPAVLFDPSKQAEMFATGADGNLYQCLWQSGTPTGWVSWTSLGNPGKAFNLNNVLELFVTGSDGNVYHRWWTSSTENSWSSWGSLGNGGSPFPMAPTAIVDSNHGMHVFAIGTDGNSYIRQWASAGGWSAWSSLVHPGPPFMGTQAVLINPNGVLEQFLISTDGQLWDYYQQAGTATGWSAWQSIGGSGMGFNESPTAILGDSGKVMEVYETGADGNMYHTYTDASDSTAA